MVLTREKKANKLSVTLQNNDLVETYECTLSFCQNPTCTCGIITLDIVPVQDKECAEETEALSFDIDLYKKSLVEDKKINVRQKELELARRFIDQLEEEDFYLMYQIYYGYKHKITEESPPDGIDVNFAYDEVEDGLMFSYNEILPYGDTLQVTLNGMSCIIDDHYCLKPNCSCTDAFLNIFTLDEQEKIEKELCVFSLDYKKIKWKTVESSSADFDLKTLRTAIEQQEPGIYSKLKKRHLRLKAIYAYNKKKHYAPKQELQIPKVGRNDPCPCGSGKKYKKCCLT
jgi:hypothetical protein